MIRHVKRLHSVYSDRTKFQKINALEIIAYDRFLYCKRLGLSRISSESCSISVAVPSGGMASMVLSISIISLSVLFVFVCKSERTSDSPDADRLKIHRALFTYLFPWLIIIFCRPQNQHPPWPPPYLLHGMCSHGRPFVRTT